MLITGGGGLLAPYLVEAASVLGNVVVTARHDSRYPCDLVDAETTRQLLATVRPDLVVHAAAMTDVDGCDRDAGAADLANHVATANLASGLPDGSKLVVVSTDQVYPDTPHLHREEDAAPVNTYGRTKLAGEEAALEHAGTLVVRTNFFGHSRTPGRQSLSDFVIESLRHRRPVTLFTDILFSPLHAATLAALLFEMVERKLAGVFNATSRGGMSKADFALAIAAHMGLSVESATRGTSDVLPERVPRASNLRMDPGRLERALGRAMPTLAEEIAKL